MPFTASKDKEYGDCYIGMSKTEKRLKLFKRKNNDYEFEQRISLITEELDKLMKKVARYETRCQSQKGKKRLQLLKDRSLKNLN